MADIRAWIASSRRCPWTPQDRQGKARRTVQLVGSDRYSWPALNRLDRQAVGRLPRMGTFLEVGGNDGYSQSNTYYLEKHRAWHGILIEPLPSLSTLRTQGPPRLAGLQPCLRTPEHCRSAHQPRRVRPDERGARHAGLDRRGRAAPAVRAPASRVVKHHVGRDRPQRDRVHHVHVDRRRGRRAALTAGLDLTGTHQTSCSSRLTSQSRSRVLKTMSCVTSEPSRLPFARL